MPDDLLEKHEQLITLLQAEIKDLKDEMRERELVRVVNAVIDADSPPFRNEALLRLEEIVQKHDGQI